MDKRHYAVAVLEPQPFMQYDSIGVYIGDLADKFYDIFVAVRDIVPGLSYFGKAARQREKNRTNQKHNKKRQAKQTRIKNPSGKSKCAQKGDNHEFWANNPANDPERTREIDRQGIDQRRHYGGYYGHDDDPYTPSWVWR